MDAKVTWQKDLSFIGLADSGYAVKMDGQSGPDSGASPVELTVMALAGCTAMDIISILTKKKELVKEFEVRVQAERASDYPKVITRALLEYVVSGHNVKEESLRRAIELSLEQYCPVHAMLVKAFPIEVRYSIFEPIMQGEKLLMQQGVFP
jgi:putative redox protein